MGGLEKPLSLRKTFFSVRDDLLQPKFTSYYKLLGEKLISVCNNCLNYYILLKTSELKENKSCPNNTKSSGATF